MVIHAHPHADDLPAFALGALDAEKARRIRLHLAACPRCRTTVKDYYTVVSLLPYAAPLQKPAEHLKWRLLASVADTKVVAQIPQHWSKSADCCLFGLSDGALSGVICISSVIR
jgi:anti-sigma factor RsiW